jgi:hypothetical protein
MKTKATKRNRKSTSPRRKLSRVGSMRLLAALAEWERVAFENERAFLKRFCHDEWTLTQKSATGYASGDE